MPPIRTLITDPVKPGSTTEAALANTPGTPGTDGAALMIPSFLSNKPAIPASVDDLPDATGGPYVSVATARAGKWLQLKAAGIAEGEFYLYGDDKFVKVHPLRYFVVAADLFRTKMDSLGQITAATRDMTDRAFEEHAVALLIVDTGAALVPAKADFRRTWSAPGVVGMRALRDAATPEWAADPANAGAAGFQYPFGRVVLTATTQRRTSRTSGNPYFAADATAAPASLSDLKRLSEALQTPDFLEALKLSHESYTKRCESLAKLRK